MTEGWTAANSARLLVPGCRLGWRFRDPESVSEPFPEPEPREVAPSPNWEEHIYARHRRYRRLRRLGGWLLLPFAIGSVVLALLLVAAIANPRSSSSDVSIAYGGMELFAIIFVCSAVPYGFLAYKADRRRPQKQIRKKQDTIRLEHQRQYAEWQQRKAAHQREQAEKATRAYRWLPVAVPGGGRRLDVVGGTPYGWESVLTVYGASLLCERPVLVIDLSWNEVVHPLAALAASAGRGVRAEWLPARLAESAVCADLTPGQLVDALVAAIHSRDETPGGRAERSRDHHILSRLATALTGTVTVGRLAAAVRVLTNGTATDPRLRAEEIAHIRDGLFARDNLEHARPALNGLESWLHPLQDLGVRRAPAPAADLTCLALAGDRRNPGSELLAELIVQDLTHRIDALAAQRPAPAVIIAGAEEIAPDHADRLAGAAQRRGVPLTLLFRHLRASSPLIGGGTVAFMRLGNPDDAGRAADFIGRHRTFTLSSMTRTHGGDETDTTATTDGRTHTTARSREAGLTADPLNLTAGLNLSAGRSRSEAVERSQTRSHASGTTWSQASTYEKAETYTVEPSSLRILPEESMLLAEPVDGAPARITSIEVSPGIAASPMTDPGRPDPSSPA